MALESWITPEETPALAAEATIVIDARLARLSEAQRDAYWASIRKAYNTPYNTPAKPIVIVEPARIELAEIELPQIELAEIELAEIELPVAAIAAAAMIQEAHAA